MKDFARFKDETGKGLPDWIAILSFAEQFGINPDDVERSVSVATWLRWLYWEKTKASRATWEQWRSPGEKNFTPAQRYLFDWAAWSEEY